MKSTLVKSFALVFFVISIVFSSCKKDSTYLEDLKQQEIVDREAYIEAESITTTPTESGLYYIETEAGTGVQAQAGNVVNVHYEGQLLNGTKFDSSWDRGAPFEFTLGTGSVIKGWDEAVALMKEGGTAKLIIPSDLAYGVTGNGSIAPYSTLIFYVELVDVQ